MIPSGHQFGNRVLPIPYRPIRFVDKGAVGEVWKASGPGGLVVAVKIVELYGREGIKEFEGLQRIKNIRQPNLVPIIGYWLIEGGQIVEPISSGLSGAAMGSQPASPSSFDAGDSQAVASGPVTLVIAMGWGEKSLFSRLQECGKGGIPWDELLGYMDDAAKGIDYLNAGPPEPGVPGPGTPIIHGDIKPQNMLIVGDGVQVCDFGLARAVEAARKTTTGMGTVAYAAPELLRGKPHRTSDQYCLAISYVELRTGRLPFEEDLTPSEVVLRHERGDLDFSRLAPGEREVIRQATCRDPDQRWSLCRHMVRALRRACEAEAAAVAGQPAQRELAKALEPSREPAEDTGPVGRTLVVDQPPGAELTQTPSLRQVAETVRLHPKPSEPTPPPRPRRGRWLAVLLLLIAVGGTIIAVPEAWDWFWAFFKPDPIKKIERLIDGERFSDAVKKLKETRLTDDEKKSLDEKLRDKWRAEVDRLERAKEYGHAIGVFEEASDYIISSDGEREERRGKLVSLWSSQIKQLGKAGEFVQALQKLNAAPQDGELGRLKPGIKKEVCTHFDEQFRALVKKESFKKAREMLDSRPPDLIDNKTLESLKGVLRTAETKAIRIAEIAQLEARRRAVIAQVDQDLLNASYAEAVDALDNARRQDVLPEADYSSQREKVLAAWLPDLELQSKGQPDSPAVLDACEALLKRFPESAEAKLFRARGLMHKKEYKLAQKDLEPSDIAVPFAPLRLVVKFIADFYEFYGNGSQAKRDALWKAKCEKFRNEAEKVLAAIDTDQRFGMQSHERQIVERILEQIRIDLKGIEPPPPRAQGVAGRG